MSDDEDPTVDVCVSCGRTFPIAPADRPADGSVCPTCAPITDIVAKLHEHFTREWHDRLRASKPRGRK